jgi:hypothetical protein
LRVFLEVVEEGFFPGQKSHLGGLYRRTAHPCQWQMELENSNRAETGNDAWAVA